MKEILATPLFGIMISIITFEIGRYLYKKTKNPIINPLLISIGLIIGILLIFNIDVEYYEYGGNYISFFLGPATVILAVPLYKQIDLLKANIIPILTGITAGSITAIISVWGLGRLLKLDTIIIASMVPKSVTMPIGVEISRQLSALQPITVLSIVTTGILGVALAPIVFKVLKIDDEVATGISLGTTSHGLGAAKAMELGEVEGAMAGLSMGVAGLITVLIAPFIAKLLNLI